MNLSAHVGDGSGRGATVLELRRTAAENERQGRTNPFQWKISILHSVGIWYRRGKMSGEMVNSRSPDDVLVVVMQGGKLADRRMGAIDLESLAQHFAQQFHREAMGVAGFVPGTALHRVVPLRRGTWESS